MAVLETFYSRALLRAGSARAGYFVPCPAGFKYLHEWRAAQLLWATYAYVETTSQEKLTFKWHFLCFSFPHCLLFCQWTRKSLKSIFFIPSHLALYVLIRPLQTLLFSRLSIPTYPSLFSWERCSKPLIMLVALSRFPPVFCT